MKNVLLVDTNFSSIPIYKSLLADGFKVYVAGKNPNDLLAKTCQGYIDVDYSNTEKLIPEIIKREIEFIIPGCTDKSYESCSLIAKDIPNIWLGDNYENFININNKYSLRNICSSLKIPTPKFFESIESAINSDSAVIVKPVDSFSGKGISIIEKKQKNKKTIACAIDYSKSNSPTKKFIIEEFVNGQLFSHSAFLENDKVKNSFIVREDCTANPFAVDSSYVVNKNECDLGEKIALCIENISKHLSLTNGLIHTQFISNGKDFWIIEITRRCPGDLYANLIELSTQFPYSKIYKNYFIDKKTKAPKIKSKINSNLIRHTLTSSGPGILNEIEFNEKLLIKKYIPMKKNGDTISKAGERLGVIFIDSNKKNYENLIDHKIYQTSIIDFKNDF